MTTRIDGRFTELKKQGRSAFITFLMTGDPDSFFLLLHGLLRNDGMTHFRILAARCARGLPKTSALKTEGVGNAGRPMHPQPRVRYW
jgi:hypothetical protein